MNNQCTAGAPIDMAGATAVILTSTGFEVRSAADGHTLGTIAAPSTTWWKLATDGSYIVAGSSTSVSAWSPLGQLLFSRSGNYSQAVAFAAPGEVLIGAGPAGANVIETLAVPSGASTTGPQFNGTFVSWFTDGEGFITAVGSTVLVYSNAVVQQASFTSVSNPLSPLTVVGQGNWVWTASTGVLNIYPATGGPNPASAASYTLPSGVQPVASGMTIGVSTGPSTFSVIDLSGSTPSKTDYTSSALSAFPGGSDYATASASQWVLGNANGMLIDGASLTGTAHYFGFGEAWSIVGGSGHFAIATASGILYFNSVTLAQEGQIPFVASELALSTDGTVLVALGSGEPSGNYPVQVYSLPAGTQLYSWPYTLTAGSGTVPLDIVLSGSGTVLGQVLFNDTSGVIQQASAPTGGSPIFSSTFSTTVRTATPPLRISPDGTLIAYSQPVLPNIVNPDPNLATNLLKNGTLVTAFTGFPAGWLDNSRLVVNSYTANGIAGYKYSACTLYGPDGNPTGGACAIPYGVGPFQPVTSDAIYVPSTDQILSVSTGSISWMSGDPVIMGAVAGSNVTSVSGVSLLAQSF